MLVGETGIAAGSFDGYHQRIRLLGAGVAPPVPQSPPADQSPTARAARRRVRGSPGTCDPMDVLEETLLLILDTVKNRYEKGPPVRLLLDQDLDEEDALVNLTLPARGFGIALKDAVPHVDAALKVVDKAAFPVGFSRPQAQGRKQEPNELERLLLNELRDIRAHHPDGASLIDDWLQQRRGALKKLVLLVLSRSGWAISTKTIEKALSPLRPALAAEPSELENNYGPLRGDSSG